MVMREFHGFDLGSVARDALSLDPDVPWSSGTPDGIYKLFDTVGIDSFLLSSREI